MAETTLEISKIIHRDGLADVVSFQWDRWNGLRAGWLAEKEELRNYIFATDTSRTTSEDGVPWKNKTTLPKLCQIRDNLHANYISSLFPNDDWLKWEGYSTKDETKNKKTAIQAYMSNKARVGNLRNEVSKLLYDYIDYGISIADVIWVNEVKELNEEQITGYVGPKLVRISPMDIVFDPLATDFRNSPKIKRSLIRLGELKLLNKEDPEKWPDEVVEKAFENRASVARGSIKKDDLNKSAGINVDGFGDYHSYMTSGYVEILEFQGSMHDPHSGEFMEDHVITVIDRQHVVRKEPIPEWQKGGLKVFTSWRKRPDNLYGMGPLDNLVGMQYRLDHLENAKADAWDLVITPMFKIIGDVDEFEFYPGGEVHIAEGGSDVVPLSVPAQALQSDQQIGYLMQLMEEFSGAPKQAMGIRTPGEKTAFEVQALENAAGRIFQEKITQFETELLEPALNNMLALAVRKMNTGDIIRVLDDDLGVARFASIKKEDITAKGHLRPIGARHFSQRSQLLQNLAGIVNTGVWAKVEKHVSDKQLAKLVEDALQLDRFDLVSDHAGLFDQIETQRLAQTATENLEVEAATPIEE